MQISAQQGSCSRGHCRRGGGSTKAGGCHSGRALPVQLLQGQALPQLLARAHQGLPSPGPALLTGAHRGAARCLPHHPKASGVSISRSETSLARLVSTSENRFQRVLSNLIWGLDTCPDIYGVWFIHYCAIFLVGDDTKI